MMKFDSKIMLFGEYTILYHSDALLIPYGKFYGELDFISNNQLEDEQMLKSNKSLKELHHYLQAILPESNLTKSFKLNQFKQDIENGLYFKSNIPIGYGIGSSGALIAAIYSCYSDKVFERLNKSDLLNLKGHFALLESFFHGRSSGIDPMLSYLNQGILVSNGNVLVEDFDYSLFHPFLIDTKISRSTADFVKLFHEKCNNSKFTNILTTRFINANNECINYFRQVDTKNFFKSIKELSSLQFENFKEMILPEFQSIWKLGLESDDFYLKLCGAGGGGYILGFTRHPDSLKELRKEYLVNFIEI